MPGSQIPQAFTARFPQSQKLAEQARQTFPSGVTHDGRYLEPFPIFVTHASGSQKFTPEGHAILDYWVGHGSLLMGHSHPAIVSAVQQQMAQGTHFSACHELEVGWGQRIQKLVPSAERVRFTSSGTEATLMAIRVCRLVTGRPKIAKFVGHFHGWHDFLVPGAYSPYGPTDWSMPGIPQGVLSDLVMLPPNDLAAVEQAFAQEAPACLIVEGTGGHWGRVPMRGEFLQGLRDLTTHYGVHLIFDEVISGFRVHPGGSQAYYKVTPDLTTLAKVVAGGLPGGALAGRADLMEAIAFNNVHGKKMKHPGTYNGNPLSAAAGIAALDLLANGLACEHANQMARQLRSELNALFATKKANWAAYGDFSMVHILPNYDGPRLTTDDQLPGQGTLEELDSPIDAKFTHAFRASLLTHGVDWFGWSGLTSAAHTEANLAATVSAFEKTLGDLREDGWIS